MSTAAVSTSAASLQNQQYFYTRQTDLHQLGKALDTGDVAGAQTAYKNIVQLGQNGPFSSGNPFSNPQREQDFTAIGTALQSGNLTAAQQAFSSLKTTFENNNGGQPAPISNPLPRPVGPAPVVGPEIIVNLSSGSSGTSPIAQQITIDLNPTAGGGEKVSLSVGQQGSNQQQQVTLNLPANSNEEIVLNLLGGSSSSGSSSSSTSAGGGLSVSA